MRLDSFPNSVVVEELSVEDSSVVGSFERGPWTSADFDEASPSLGAAAVRVGSGKTSSPSSRMRLRAAFL